MSEFEQLPLEHAELIEQCGGMKRDSGTWVLGLGSPFQLRHAKKAVRARLAGLSEVQYQQAEDLLRQTVRRDLASRESERRNDFVNAWRDPY